MCGSHYISIRQRQARKAPRSRWKPLGCLLSSTCILGSTSGRLIRGLRCLRRGLGHSDSQPPCVPPRGLCTAAEKTPLLASILLPQPSGLWLWRHSSRRRCQLGPPQPLPDPGILPQSLHRACPQLYLTYHTCPGPYRQSCLSWPAGHMNCLTTAFSLSLAKKLCLGNWPLPRPLAGCVT